MTISWRALHAEATARLGRGVDAAREARWMCEDAAGVDASEWPSMLDEPATVGGVRRLDAYVARRLAGEPLQYVLGHWPFRGVDLFVDRRVLIPRPETEHVAGLALERARALPRPLTIVDLGTGSGAIALALAAELPLAGVEIWATDVDPDALDVARANLAGLGRAAANVRLARGDWYGALPDEMAGRVSLVVANPPYIAEAEDVDPSVRDWEPSTALFAGEQGLAAIATVVGGAARWLVRGGALVVEIGAAQGEAAARLARDAGLVDVRVLPDAAGRDRALVAEA